MYSISTFGQTFTYLGSFDLTDSGEPDELCLTVYDDKFFILYEDSDEVDIYSATSPYSFDSSVGSGQFGNSEDGISVYSNLRRFLSRVNFEMNLILPKRLPTNSLLIIYHH